MNRLELSGEPKWRPAKLTKLEAQIRFGLLVSFVAVVVASMKLLSVSSSGENVWGPVLNLCFYLFTFKICMMNHNRHQESVRANS